jgi:2-oxoglutarate dehydrogenase E1 component
VADFTSGTFQEVLDDDRLQANGVDRGSVRRVVLHSGKIHHDLRAEAEKRGVTDVALVRLEQLAPLPLDRVLEVLASYPAAEVVFAQEEPENQGAWPFVCMNLSPHLDGRPLSVAARSASAAPATGSSKRSAAEAAEVIDRALSA